MVGSKFTFVQGKGGVGRTSVARAIALAQARAGKRTVIVTLNRGETDPRAPDHKNLLSFDVEPISAFREYLNTKVPLGILAKLVLDNRFVHQLIRISPGFKELLCMGKVWDLQEDFDRVIVDMPSTGFGLVHFEAILNFHRLFKDGRIYKHTTAMLESFQDPAQTEFLIVALPEELPLREAWDLERSLKALFPSVKTTLVVNRVFPKVEGAAPLDSGPFPKSLQDYALSRQNREREAIASTTLNPGGAAALQLPFVTPPIADHLADTISRARDAGGPS